MNKQYQYLVALRRKDGSRDVYIPSLKVPDNAGCLTASQFVESQLQTLLKPNSFTIDFLSQPDEFGILAITCDTETAEQIQDMSPVATVLPMHAACTSDPWDLLPIIEDDNTRMAFAELRNERRFQKDVELGFSQIQRCRLKDCTDFVELEGDKVTFKLPTIGNYLGLSQEELSEFMVIAPNHLNSIFPTPSTSDNVTNRARALFVIAYMLRSIYKTNDSRATDWMQRKQPEGWQYNGLSAKECFLQGHYHQVFRHLQEVTRNPNLKLCGGMHLCSHNFHCMHRHS